MYISYRTVSSIYRVRVLAWRDDGREGKEREELFIKRVEHPFFSLNVSLRNY